MRGSVAEAYGPAVLGILLTGNSADGAAGLHLIMQAGGETLVENPGSASAPVMPAAAVATNSAGRVLRLADLTRCIHDARTPDNLNPFESRRTR